MTKLERRITNVILGNSCQEASNKVGHPPRFVFRITDLGFGLLTSLKLEPVP